MVIRALSLMMAVAAFVLLTACSQTEPVQSVDISAEMPGSDRSTIEASESKATSALIFEPNHVDMGSVKEGDEAVVFLRVRNAGDVMANIVAVETSCGCSVAEPEQHLLMPGGFTRIKVVVDTFAKQGEAKKWVQLTDDLGKTNKAWLKFQVQANPHLNTAERGIFKGKCAACHFDTAKGKVKGPELYGAVCSMCHGGKAEGVSGPSLRHHDDIGVLAELIAKGTGSHHMPGFALSEGGPLTSKQVNALSQWLSTLDETGQNR